MLVIALPIANDVKPVQEAKALLPIVITEFGIVIDVIPVQP
jgi:hypothetical protein